MAISGSIVFRLAPLLLPMVVPLFGGPARLGAIEVTGSSLYPADYVKKVSGLKGGQPIDQFD